MTFELWLITGLVLVGVIAVVALLVALLRPLKALIQISTLDAKLQRTIQKLDDLRTAYNSLASQYLLIIGENQWLREQLRTNGIKIPPLPDYLKPHTDESGNIVISVRQGGVDMNDQSSISSERDVVAGNRVDGSGK